MSWTVVVVVTMHNRAPPGMPPGSRPQGRRDFEHWAPRAVAIGWAGPGLALEHALIFWTPHQGSGGYDPLSLIVGQERRRECDKKKKFRLGDGQALKDSRQGAPS